MALSGFGGAGSGLSFAPLNFSVGFWMQKAAIVGTIGIWGVCGRSIFCTIGDLGGWPADYSLHYRFFLILF